MIVAIQGAPGSFSDGAARHLAGARAEMLNCTSFDDLFAAVATGQADRGVVPVHNTIAGPVYDNAVRASATAFVIMDFVRYPVRQCLIAPRRMPIAKLRRVASHPVALRQCTRFFGTYPDCLPVPVSDTGSGVRDLMKGGLDACAVIGSSAAARLYGAKVLIEGVEDRADNVTEFVMISRRMTPLARDTSWEALRDRPGEGRGYRAQADGVVE